MTELPKKAVILACGLGTRMLADAPDVDLTPEQQRIADVGLKALIPVAGGKTLLELMFTNLTDAGFTDVCMVIGPEHGAIREFCAARSINVTFAIQQEPRGTADAILAAESCVAQDEPFLVINSDNLYPVESLRRLRETKQPAMLAFERAALIENSNIPPDRIAKFATVELDEQGNLLRVVEKPESFAVDSLVSMNAWLFTPAIFNACRAIGPSARGEFEITTAVQYAIDELGDVFTAVRSSEGVLDLSSRADIESVARVLNAK